MQKQGIFHQISKHVTVHVFFCLWLLNIINEFEKHEKASVSFFHGIESMMKSEWQGSESILFRPIQSLAIKCELVVWNWKYKQKNQPITISLFPISLHKI